MKDDPLASRCSSVAHCVHCWVLHQKDVWCGPSAHSTHGREMCRVRTVLCVSHATSGASQHEHWEGMWTDQGAESDLELIVELSLGHALKNAEVFQRIKQGVKETISAVSAMGGAMLPICQR